MIKQANNTMILFRFYKITEGSDQNAAVYWFGRMIAGGEDVKFIARRMVILAKLKISATTLMPCCWQMPFEGE